MKRFWSVVLAILLLLGALPMGALAAKQMNDGVPVWDHDTVRAYLVSYIAGDDLETLWGYYDLQIRRYMPMRTYQSMLSDLKWATGAFIGFGGYSSFEEPERKTKTHVLHLCMEKQDLDVYFTHKNKPDDWEVMALEFAFAEEQEPGVDNADYIRLTETGKYTEEEVVVGSAPWELGATLTIPEGASADKPVPACVLVHGSGPSDRDESVGKLTLFADIAREFAKAGIATLRYDKRTFVYGAQMSADETAVVTVEEETILDAIAAGRLLNSYDWVDKSRVILVGHSMGAMLAPRIATEANGLFKAMLMIAGTPDSLLDVIVAQNEALIMAMDESEQVQYLEQLDALKVGVGQLADMDAEQTKELSLFGVNAYYFWEMMQHDSVAMLKKLKLPTYIVQGSEDFQIPVESGVEKYESRISDKESFVSFRIYQGLNHFLMAFEGDPADKGTVQEYESPATLDAAAAQDMINWIKGLTGAKDR